MSTIAETKVKEERGDATSTTLEERSLEETKIEALSYALSRGGSREKENAVPVAAFVQRNEAVDSVVDVSNGEQSYGALPTQRKRTLEEVKAEARAYALSGGKDSRKKAKIKNVPVPAGKSCNCKIMPHGTSTSTVPIVTLESPSNVDATTGWTHSTSSSEKLPDLNDDFDEDYAEFINVLRRGPNFDLDNADVLLLDDDEEECQWEEEDSADFEDGYFSESDSDAQVNFPSYVDETGNSQLSTGKEQSTLEHLESDSYCELDEEMFWLEEEEMEAAASGALLNYGPAASNCGPIAGNYELIFSLFGRQLPVEGKCADETNVKVNVESVRPTVESETFAELGTLPMQVQPPTAATAQQHQQLKELLEKHHQLLLQQVVLSVRAAHQRRHCVTATSQDPERNLELLFAPDDLEAVLDGTVKMLLDLDQNRKDAIRHHIQFEAICETSAIRTGGEPPRNRFLLPERRIGDRCHFGESGTRSRLLTRSQFSKILERQEEVHRKTIFDIRGLSNLESLFSTIDGSVDGISTESESILNMDSNAEACKKLLRQSGGVVDMDLLPGSRDISLNFVDLTEIFGEQFEPPCSRTQQIFLKTRTSFFTAGEDNLVYRGVHLYGEKQWSLISDRYLPLRSIHNISNRYSKLCFLLYKAHGIKIDVNGNFTTPPKCKRMNHGDLMELAKLQRVDPPAILSVHRWSIEEDIVLLKAVALMGCMYVDLRDRLIPHRDRAHLRKRYQVLERRMKATAARTLKLDKMTASKM